MLLMVIERFKDGSAKRISERFKRDGRMLGEGVTYHQSWVDAEGTRCYQLMEALNPQALDDWIAHWDDLADFEVVPVLTSSDFWSRFEAGPAD
jgi:hypothetical protein